MASAKPLTRAELYQRIHALPEEQRAEAISLTLEVYGGRVIRPSELTRDVMQRRALAGDFGKYVHDILGWRLTAQQERVADEIARYDRILIPSGNSLGKTWLLAAYAVFRFDAVAALPDAEHGYEEQGCRILLPGPKYETILATIYSKILAVANRAEARGFLMPGFRSDRKVKWFVRPEWEMEAFSPPKKTGQSIAHSASGRHHANMVSLMEEGQGIMESLWNAQEGTCSAVGNKIISSFQPAEASGPAFMRANGRGWRVVSLSAFDHPNVLRRLISVAGAAWPAVPGAVSFEWVDERVKNDARDRGAYPAVSPDPVHRDFVYALAPKGAAERGARDDGYLGHVDGALRVYRPGPLFEAQVLGQWPSSYDARLFSPVAWDMAVDRWKENGPDPDEPPDMVGVDVARYGSDDSCAVPRWGEGADALLRGYAAARIDREEGEERLKAWLSCHGCRVGTPRTLQKADGVGTAEQLAAMFPDSPFNVDETGVGASALDHGRVVLGLDMCGISFAASAPDPPPGVPYSMNLRTAMYVYAARLVSLGLADVPDDPGLREECLAHETKQRWKVVEERDEFGRMQKVRKPALQLIEKDEVKKIIGRSPDKADAFVEALLDAAPRYFGSPVFFTPSGRRDLFGG